MPAPGGLTLILAHPDDEAFFAAGVIASASAAGRRVELLVATRGERGRRPEGVDAGPEEFGALRLEELHAVGRLLGIHRVDWLGVTDREVATHGAVTMPVIAEALRRQRPEVVFTFAEDGHNRHPDHVAIHAIAMGAIGLAMDAQAAIHGAPIEQPRVVFTTTVPPWSPQDPAEIAAVPGVDYLIDVRRHAERKREALLLHRSQQHVIGPKFFAGPDALASCRHEFFAHGLGTRPAGEPPHPTLFD